MSSDMGKVPDPKISASYHCYHYY